MTMFRCSEMQLPTWRIPRCEAIGCLPNPNSTSGGNSMETATQLPIEWGRWLLADHLAQPRKFRPDVPLIERLLRRVEVVDSGCWLYRGSLDSAGYSCLRINGANDRGHRITWQAVAGPIPGDRHLDHLCRVRSCVNPDHLEPVTVSVNTFGRALWPTGWPKATHCPRGHEMTEENTYRRPDNGGRQCWTCVRRRTKESNDRRRRRSRQHPHSAERRRLSRHPADEG